MCVWASARVGVCVCVCARAYVCVLLRRSVLRIPAAEVSFGVDGHQGPAK